MTTRDRLLALTVVALWGINFLALRAGLDRFPPFFFAALRFLVIAVPVVVLVPRPDVPVRWLLLYGGGFGVAQFGFLFTAMNMGMPTGLASLVLQSSAPFTVLLGGVLLREGITARQLAGIGVAMLGMVAIGWDRVQHATLLPVLLTILAGLGWAFGNLGSRLAKPSKPMHLTLWMTVVPPVPFLVISATVEGPTTGWRALGSAFSADGLPALVGLGYIVLLGTIAGSGIWSSLMSRYPAGLVAPFSLLVPVVGIGLSWAVLGEQPTVLSIVGGVVVILGALAATPPVRESQCPDTEIHAQSAEPTTAARSAEPNRAGYAKLGECSTTTASGSRPADDSPFGPPLPPPGHRRRQDAVKVR